MEYWKSIKGNIAETLVFDCKFTTYGILDDLTQKKVAFVTLRKRYAKLVKETEDMPKEIWKKVYVPIPKRKHKRVSVYENQVRLKECKNSFRQIIVKDHGRSKPHTS